MTPRVPGLLMRSVSVTQCFGDTVNEINVNNFIKVWWHYATLFEIYYFLTFIHTIQSHSVHPSPFAEARLLSIYNVYTTNQFQTTFAQERRGE